MPTALAEIKLKQYEKREMQITSTLASGGGLVHPPEVFRR